MFGGADNPLGDLMNQAVKLKSAQQAQLRPAFDNWPVYYQNSMFMQESVLSLRALQTFAEKYEGAYQFKVKGNDLFNQNDFQEANAQYEKALAVFKYCENTDPDWKKKGIHDESIRCTDYEPAEADEKQLLQQLKLSCYLNIAMCKLKLREYPAVLPACKDALEIDPKNSKALYRRAMALITPKSSGATEFDMAIQDLQKAVAFDSKNIEAKKLLVKLKQDRIQQRKSDKKTFSGLFDRGQICETPEVSSKDMKDNNKREAELAKQLEDAEYVAKVYDEQGKPEKAAEIRAEVKKVKESNARVASRRNLDFSNPTEEMIKDAKSHGIDLTDPQVLKLMQDIQKEKEQELQNGTSSSSIDSKARSSNINCNNDDNSLDAAINAMTQNELIEFLKVEGVEVDKTFSTKKCREIVKNVLENKHSNQAKEKQRRGIWVFTVAIVALWFFYRIYSIGILSSVYNKAIQPAIKDVFPSSNDYEDEFEDL